MKIFLGFLLAGSLFAQTPLPSPSQGGSGGGGGGGSPASPLNSVQLNVSGSFGSDPTFIDYQDGIPDPTDAPVVAAVTTGTDSISYYIVEYTNAGQTNPSPTTTITNGNLSSLNVNITLPVESDPNITCAVVNATLGYSTGADELECDGSVINDTGPTGNLSFKIFGPPATNTTAAVIASRIGVSTINFTGAAIYGTNTYAITTTDPNGNQLCHVGIDALGNLYLQAINGSPCGNFGASNFWQQVQTCGGDGGGSTPCTATYAGPGILKADTSLGNVTWNLPAISTFPNVGLPSLGVQFIMHMPTSGNTATLATTDGATIGGTATSYSLTVQNSSIAVYWDADGDGNTGQWAIEYVYVPTVESSSALDFTSIADGSCSALTFTLAGASTGANLAPGFPSALNAGLTGSMFVSAANTVTVTLCNLSGSAIDPASLTYSAAVVQ